MVSLLSQATGCSGELTTMSESLGLEAVMERARICGLAAVLAERAAVRSSSGANLVAMTGDCVDSIAIERLGLLGSPEVGVDVDNGVELLGSCCHWKLFT